ncbi:MAG: ATP-binding protein, partial [Fidelibacterota bacterium]
KIEEKNLELMVDIDDQLPDIFEFDEIRVRQILINLIGNAIKFTDQGYIKISLNVYNKTADTFDAEFTVTDTGRGIEEDQLDHIFKSFQQNKFQKQNQYGGTGLGLAITKRLVNMMGGSIQISSKIGEGSTFSVLFKNLKITKTTALEKKDKFYNIRKIHFPGKTILVVEDIDSNLEIITKLLEKVSISVMNAQNGEEALILLENTIPDLVLMDINMPVMDGITATRIIRQREGLKNLPVVALTATAEQFTKNELTKLFDYVIHKPIDNSLLINVLSKFLHYKEIPVADSQKEQVEAGDYPVESILEDQDLMKELTTDFIHKVPVLLDEMMIDNIKNFAESLAILGHKHNNQCLANYAETLLESANSFDIANLQMWLNKFMDNLSEAEK